MRLLYRWVGAACAAMAAMSALAGSQSADSLGKYQLGLHQPNSAVAQQAYDLNSWLLIICGVIFVLVFGVMFYSIYKHRKSKGHKAANFHESVAVEIAWTVIPLLILLVMAWPATKMVLQQYDTRGEDMTIKITGYQWKWAYEYKNEGLSFFSTLSTPQDQIDAYAGKQAAPRSENYLQEVDNPMVVPVGKKIRLLVTADDVIHSWAVQQLGVKQDAIPGFIKDTWFQADKVGVYRGFCSELCGKNHGFMPIVVEVKSQADYDKWVADQKKAMAAAQDDPNKVWDLAGLKARGEKVYAKNCVSCHQANGGGVAGSFPALDGSPVVKGPIAEQLNVVMHGREGTAMVAFEKQLSDTEIAAVVAYTRNNWSNKTGDFVQPAEVKALRK